VTTEDTEKPQNYTGANHDSETDGNAANADANGVMAVYVERLCGPEHDNREEVRAGDEGDYKRQPENARLLLQAAWKYRIVCTVDLPEGERD
jgi:hypothetical protein